MKVLTFEPAPHGTRRDRARRARFAMRSRLPVSAACVVANGIRETLAALFATDVRVRVIEPLLPDSAAWQEIVRNATLFCARGDAATAYAIVRADDAAALAGAAFGEKSPRDGPLSPMESAAFSRAMNALASALHPVCGGGETPSLRRVDAMSAQTYFEVLVDRPIVARIGIALARDPAAPGVPAFTAQSLRDVPLDVSVEFASGWITGASLATLAPGSVVPLQTRVGDPGVLWVGNHGLAKGECGTSRGVRAFVAERAFPAGT